MIFFVFALNPSVKIIKYQVHIFFILHISFFEQLIKKNIKKIRDSRKLTLPSYNPNFLPNFTDRGEISTHKLILFSKYKLWPLPLTSQSFWNLVAKIKIFWEFAFLEQGSQGSIQTWQMMLKMEAHLIDRKV